MTKKNTASRAPIDDLVARCDPAARGIVQCLKMLAEEAESLKLQGTWSALNKAMKTCAAESVEMSWPSSAGAGMPPPSTARH